MTLSPYNIQQEQDSRPLYHLDRVNESKALLQSLDEGVYSIKWEGVLPQSKNYAGINRDKKIKIRVEQKIDLGNILRLKKPVLTKEIEIFDDNVICIEKWTMEQIIELNSNLVWILNGIYTDEAS
jgi:hypothetical protein